MSWIWSVGQIHQWPFLNGYHRQYFYMTSARQCLKGTWWGRKQCANISGLQGEVEAKVYHNVFGDRLSFVVLVFLKFSLLKETFAVMNGPVSTPHYPSNQLEKSVKSVVMGKHIMHSSISVASYRRFYCSKKFSVLHIHSLPQLQSLVFSLSPMTCLFQDAFKLKFSSMQPLDIDCFTLKCTLGFLLCFS